MSPTKRVSAEHLRQGLRLGLMAGAAGGLVEIVWIALYGMLTGKDTTVIARSISDVLSALWTVSPLAGAPVMTGIAIHMVAAIGLGIGLAFAFRALREARWAPANAYAFALPALSAVWGFNFLVVLPLLSPHFDDLHRSFVDVVPYPVSLGSKLLFGLAVAATLQRHTRRSAILVRA